MPTANSLAVDRKDSRQQQSIFKDMRNFKCFFISPMKGRTFCNAFYNFKEDVFNMLNSQVELQWWIWLYSSWFNHCKWVLQTILNRLKMLIFHWHFTEHGQGLTITQQDYLQKELILKLFMLFAVLVWSRRAVTGTHMLEWLTNYEELKTDSLAIILTGERKQICSPAGVIERSAKRLMKPVSGLSLQPGSGDELIPAG